VLGKSRSDVLILAIGIGTFQEIHLGILVGSKVHREEGGEILGEMRLVNFVILGPFAERRNLVGKEQLD
jgi:hypothetical protein